VTDKRAALGAELVIPLLALGFTVYFLATTSAMEWEAKANGVIVGWILIALIAVQLVRSAIDLARGRATLSFAPLVQPADAMRKRIGMLVVMIALVAGVPWAGVGLGLFLALAAGFAVMGVRPLRRILVVSFCVALTCSLLFTVALDSGLPHGPVENLLLRATR
jgi:apolipoprotein N-acyltransferase